MTQEELADIQMERRLQVLSNLLSQCVERFLDAARLVNLRGPIIERIENERHRGGVDLAPLCPAYELICERYRNERFEFQASLFRDHDSDALERWNRFLYRELFTSLLQDDEFVRNVLRVSGLLPCHSIREALSAILHRISEMHRPYGTAIGNSLEMEW